MGYFVRFTCISQVFSLTFVSLLADVYHLRILRMGLNITKVLFVLMQDIITPGMDLE